MGKGEIKKLKERQKLTKSGIIVVLTLVIANLGLVWAIRMYSLSQTCFTKTQITTDARCLYILNNKVFEKGSRSKPHKGHPCGMDVTSIIPGFHLAEVAKYLDPNYKGTVCTQVSPTVTSKPPTATRIPTATKTPTLIPTLTLRPSVTWPPTATKSPIPTPTQIPTFTPPPIGAPTFFPTATLRPSVTWPPTATNAPTVTRIPTATATRSPSPTLRPSATSKPTVTRTPTTRPPTPTVISRTNKDAQRISCPVPGKVTNIKITCPNCL